MIKTLINTASYAPKKRRNSMWQEQKLSATQLSTEKIFQSKKKKKNLHMLSLPDPARSFFLFSPSRTLNSGKIESLQSRWAHADKLCDALPSASKQTNGTLRFHKGDYQNVKHLSLPLLVWRCWRRSAEEEVQTKGRVLTRWRGER